jgi:hypothetical protein
MDNTEHRTLNTDNRLNRMFIFLSQTLVKIEHYGVN